MRKIERGVFFQTFSSGSTKMFSDRLMIGMDTECETGIEVITCIPAELVLAGNGGGGIKL